MSKNYTAAIVGCGSIGHAHAAGYRVAGVEIVAVADPVAEARRQYIREYGPLEEFASVDELLAGSSPDIISVCTWHQLHPEPVIAAGNAGVRGVICEKPMAVCMADADRMIEACDAGGTRLVVSHQRRFTRGWERARELVREGAIGKPVTVDSKIAAGLLNWGTHTIDGVRFVLGDPDPVWVMGAVERRTDRHERNTPIEDSCIGLIHFDSGAQMTIQCDLDMEGASAGSFLVRGAEGMIAVSEARVSLFNGETGGWREIDLGEEEIAAIGGNTNAAQVRELIAWIEGGPEHRGTGRQARVTVEIMMSLYESARRRRAIHMPLQERGFPLEQMIDGGELAVEEEGRYDIRGFLSWEGVDSGRFDELRDQGLGHHQIMMRLHEEKQQAQEGKAGAGG